MLFYVGCIFTDIVSYFLKRKKKKKNQLNIKTVQINDNLESKNYLHLKAFYKIYTYLLFYI